MSAKQILFFKTNLKMDQTPDVGAVRWSDQHGKNIPTSEIISSKTRFSPVSLPDFHTPADQTENLVPVTRSVTTDKWQNGRETFKKWSVGHFNLPLCTFLKFYFSLDDFIAAFLPVNSDFLVYDIKAMSNFFWIVNNVYLLLTTVGWFLKQEANCHMLMSTVQAELTAQWINRKRKRQCISGCVCECVYEKENRCC